MAENRYFGRSQLLPLSLSPRPFEGAPVPESFGQKTYRFKAPDGRTITVWSQKINGFQHVYGSGLTCLELGDSLSEQLFCINELIELAFDGKAQKAIDRLERKKDLANNGLGRSIALSIKNQGLSCAGADEALMQECARAAESSPRFYGHCLDPRVKSIANEDLGSSWFQQLVKVLDPQ